MADTTSSDAETLFRKAMELQPTDIEGWGRLFAEDAVFELPYAGSFEAPTHREGRTAVIEGMKWFMSLIRDLDNGPATISKIAGQDAIIAEYVATGKMAENGKPFDQIYIARIEARDGLITHYKEYFDTLRFKYHLEG